MFSEKIQKKLEDIVQQHNRNQELIVFHDDTDSVSVHLMDKSYYDHIMYMSLCNYEAGLLKKTADLMKGDSRDGE